MELLQKSVSRRAKDWISGDAGNPYERLSSLKHTPLHTQSAVEELDQRQSSESISGVALFHRLKLILLQKAKAKSETDKTAKNTASSPPKKSSRLTKFEKQYLEHLKQIMEEQRSIAI